MLLVHATFDHADLKCSMQMKQEERCNEAARCKCVSEQHEKEKIQRNRGRNWVDWDARLWNQMDCGNAKRGGGWAEKLERHPVMLHPQAPSHVTAGRVIGFPPHSFNFQNRLPVEHI